MSLRLWVNSQQSSPVLLSREIMWELSALHMARKYVMSNIWSKRGYRKIISISLSMPTLVIFIQNLCLSSNYVHPPGGWIYYFCFFRRPMSDVRRPVSGVRRPMSGVTHGFRSFKGKVLELLSPNLVCRLIGSVACLGLLLAVVPLLLTE